MALRAFVLHFGLATGAAVFRNRIEALVQHKAPVGPVLLQASHSVAQGVGPDLLGDVGLQIVNDGVEVAQVPVKTSSIGGDKLQVEQTGSVSKSLAAVEITEPQSVKGSPEHGMRILDKENPGSKELVSVRLDHALADGEQVFKLFAEGARAAVANVAPTGSSSWWSASAEAMRGAKAAAPEAVQTGMSSPGAMTFFSSSARATPSSIKEHKEQSGLSAKPTSMMAVGAATVAADAVRADAPPVGPLSLEAQRRALALTEQVQERRAAEEAQAQELERQGDLEETMNRVADASSWGI